MPYKFCRASWATVGLVSLGVFGFNVGGASNGDIPSMAITGLSIMSGAISGLKCKSNHNHVWEQSQKIEIVQDFTDTINEHSLSKKI